MCDQCEVLMINGIKCHETGCPLAWEDELRECVECGQEFKPESRYQHACSEECATAYAGY